MLVINQTCLFPIFISNCGTALHDLFSIINFLWHSNQQTVSFQELEGKAIVEGLIFIKYIAIFKFADEMSHYLKPLLSLDDSGSPWIIVIVYNICTMPVY